MASKTRSISLDDALDTRVREEAHRRHMTVAGLVREALVAHLGADDSMGAGLDRIRDKVGRVENALDHVLVAAVRIEERLKSK